MAIDSLDDVIAGLSAARRNNLVKASITNAAGGFVSLWRQAGFPPPAPANPPLFSVGGEIPTKATVGSIPFGATPSGGNSLYLGRIQMSSSIAGTFIVYDRLWHCAGMDGTLITPQVIAPAPVLTRVTDYTQVEAWIEVYTALGATPVTATLSYTNEADVAGRSATQTTVASFPVNRMQRFTLQAGDLGLKSVASVTLSATTGTAGNFGITLMRRIAEIPITIPNVASVQDGLLLGLPTVHTDAALAIMNLSTTTSSGSMMGSADVIEG